MPFCNFTISIQNINKLMQNAWKNWKPTTFSSFWCQEQVEATNSFTDLLLYFKTTGPALQQWWQGTWCVHVLRRVEWMTYSTIIQALDCFCVTKNNIPIFPEEILYKGWKQLFSIIVKVNLLFKWNIHRCSSFPDFYKGLLWCVKCVNTQTLYINQTQPRIHTSSKGWY